MNLRRSQAHGGRGAAGFSFLELLVVMGILAVLAGIGAVVYRVAFQRKSEFATKTLLQKVGGDIDLFRSRYGTYPASSLAMLPAVLGTPLKVGRTTPSNTTNVGVEAMYQSFVAPGVGVNPNLDADKSNTDRDAFDRALDPRGDPKLYEVKDEKGNPLVYILDADYEAFEKAPPVYLDKDGVEFRPKPWRNPDGSGFAQPHGYQLFSIGPDGVPNTADDAKAWE